MRRSLLILGATSLVGSDFVERRPRGLVCVAAGRTHPASIGLRVDGFVPTSLVDEEAVRRLVRDSSADTVVNFAARTDVDGCESERPDRWPSDPAVLARSSAWTLNAELPRWVAEECAAREARFIQLSTDYVFDGGRGPYAEAEPPSPWGPRVSWYGYSKGHGEIATLRSGPLASVIRISFPYRFGHPQKLDFLRTVLRRYAEGTLFPLYLDQGITPTWIPDVSAIIARLLASDEGGTFHVASPSPTTPFDFAASALRAAGRSTAGLRSSSLEAELARPGRTPRPLHGGLRIDRLALMEFHPLDYLEGGRRVVAQEGKP